MPKRPGAQERACGTDVVACGRASSGYQAHRETHTEIHKRESESFNSALSHAAQLAPGVLPQRGQSTCLETCNDTHLWPPGTLEGVGGGGNTPSCPCPAPTQPRQQQQQQDRRRRRAGPAEAAAAVSQSRKRRFWQPGRQPVPSRAPNPAFIPGSDKVQITASQTQAAQPLQTFLAAALCHSAVGTKDHQEAPGSRAVPKRDPPSPTGGDELGGGRPAQGFQTQAGWGAA